MEEELGGHKYKVESYWEHIIHDYSGLNFFEIQNLDYIDYLTLRRDAFITKMNQSEKGQEYLDNAYRLEETKPNREKLRKNFGKEG